MPPPRARNFYLSANAAALMVAVGVPLILLLEQQEVSSFVGGVPVIKEGIGFFLRLDAIDYLTQINLQRAPDDPFFWKRVARLPSINPSLNLHFLFTYT